MTSTPSPHTQTRTTRSWWPRHKRNRIKMFTWIQGTSFFSQWSLASIPLLHGLTSISSSRVVVIDRKVAKKSPQFIVDSAKKCIGDYTLFFEFEKRIPISPSLWTNSDFPTEIVYWSRFTLCNLYYFIPRFSGVGIFVYPCLSIRTRVCFHGIDRDCLNKISWNLVVLQQYLSFLLCPRL